VQRLSEALTRADSQGIALAVEIAVTSDGDHPPSAESSLQGLDNDSEGQSDLDAEGIEEKDQKSYVHTPRKSPSASSPETSST
jgi:hypothetical protein